MLFFHVFPKTGRELGCTTYPFKSREVTSKWAIGWGWEPHPASCLSISSDKDGATLLYIALCSFFQLNFWHCPKWRHSIWLNPSELRNMKVIEPCHNHIPIGSMYGIFTYIHLHLVDFYDLHVGKYTVRPMDPMGLIKLCWSISRFCPSHKLPLPFPYEPRDSYGNGMGVVRVPWGSPWKFPWSNIPFSLASTASETLSGRVYQTPCVSCRSLMCL